MLIAIDHGNYAIKTPRFSFVSGLAEHTVRPPMSEEILEYGGKFWTLTTRRLPYMRDKTQDDRYFILTLFAIARELERKGQYEYLHAHPALQNPECKIELTATHSYPPEAIAQLVREMVGEQLAQAGGTAPRETPSSPQPGPDVTEMLDNLDMFL